MRGMTATGALAAALLAGAGVWAQPPDKAALTATLVNPEKNSARSAATVSVKVTGVTLTDPAS